MPGQHPCTEARFWQCQELPPLPIVWGRHVQQPPMETPPRKHFGTGSFSFLADVHRGKKKPGEPGEIFLLRGGKKKIKKKKKKKKEGGCPWQLTAAWHLCPRAGVQAPEQARCHGSRWARRQQPRASILPHQGGDGCLGQISQLRMSKQLPVWSLYTYN